MPEYINIIGHNEFPFEKLHFIRELGQGAFGTVLLADADGILEEGVKTLTAVKLLKGMFTISTIKFENGGFLVHGPQCTVYSIFVILET